MVYGRLEAQIVVREITMMHQVIIDYLFEYILLYPAPQSESLVAPE